MRSFIHESHPMRVVMGPGSLARLPDEVARVGLSRVLVLCSPGRDELGQRVSATLGDTATAVLSTARMHVPVDVVAAALDVVDDLQVDGVVAVDGGSAVGLGKAIALAREVGVVAVPTTYAGSEMTSIWGLTEDGHKRTGRADRVRAASVVYDPELTATLPVDTSVTSGMNALAHAAEGLYAPDATPLVSLMAEEGVRALVGALPRVVADPEDLEARSDAQCGAWLCGAVLESTTMSLHHRVCHALGGTLDLPHAATHAVVLPHVLAFNLPATPAAATALRRALADSEDPAMHLWQLAGRLGAPRSLHELGMVESDTGRIVDTVLADPYANPREVGRAELQALLERARSGTPPRA